MCRWPRYSRLKENLASSVLIQYYPLNLDLSNANNAASCDQVSKTSKSRKHIMLYSNFLDLNQRVEIIRKSRVSFTKGDVSKPSFLSQSIFDGFWSPPRIFLTTSKKSFDASSLPIT